MTASQIKAVRLFAGLERPDFARRLGVSAERGRRWENGTAIPLDKAALALTLFNVAPESLLPDAPPSALATRLKAAVAAAPVDKIPALQTALHAYLFEFVCRFNPGER